MANARAGKLDEGRGLAAGRPGSSPMLVSIPFSLAGGCLWTGPGVRGGGHGLWAAFVDPGLRALRGPARAPATAQPRGVAPVGFRVCSRSPTWRLTPTATRALTDPDGIVARRRLLRLVGVLDLAARHCCSRPSSCRPSIPTGRPPNRYWLWHMRAALTGDGSPGPADGHRPGRRGRHAFPARRLPWEAPVWLGYALGVPAGVLILGLRRAQRHHRDVAARSCGLYGSRTATAAVAAGCGAGDGWRVVAQPSQPLLDVAYGLVPVAVTVGVLRYRLLGIEVVLRRTFLFLPLTLLVALSSGVSPRCWPGWRPRARCPCCCHRPWWPYW